MRWLRRRFTEWHMKVHADAQRSAAARQRFIDEVIAGVSFVAEEPVSRFGEPRCEECADCTGLRVWCENWAGEPLPIEV